MKTEMNNIRLSQHFTLGEFLNLAKYPENIPTMQTVANMTYGCHLLLEPARQEVGPILINSGFRSESVNRQEGGVPNSQHLLGQAADIRPRNPQQFQPLVNFLKAHPLTDQLLTGNGWLHISWNPFGSPAALSVLATTSSPWCPRQRDFPPTSTPFRGAGFRVYSAPLSPSFIKKRKIFEKKCLE